MNGQSCIIGTVEIQAWRWVPIEGRLPFEASRFDVDAVLTKTVTGWFKKTLTFELYGPASEIFAFVNHVKGDQSWLRAQ